MGILFKGKSFGEVPMAILELLEFPEKGPIMHPDPLFMIQNFLVILKNMRVTAEL